MNFDGVSYSKFNWNSNPFSFQILPRIFVAYEKEVTDLLTGLKNGTKFSLVSGPTGCGKTALLKYLTTKFSSQEHIIYLPKPPKDPKDLVEIFQTHLKETTWEKLRRQKLNLYNLTEYANKKLKNKKCILFIDEAHEASMETLEWMRSLADQINNLSVVFAGLPVLDNLLKERLESFGKRVSLKFELSPLNKSETVDLIKKRIQNVGGVDISPFTMDSIKYIHEKSGGMPRDILKLCDETIKNAIEKSASLIDLEFVSENLEAVDENSRRSIPVLPEKQKRILQILQNSSLTPSEIASKIDMTTYKTKAHAVRSINNLLQRLMKENLVSRKKNGKAYKYQLVQPSLTLS